jgi:hypothetical protein
MRLLALRRYPFIDSESLEEHQACDRLFRTNEGAFILHMSSGDAAHVPDRLKRLNCREALIWINSPTEDFGAEWN